MGVVGPLKESEFLGKGLQMRLNCIHQFQVLAETELLEARWAFDQKKKVVTFKVPFSTLSP